MAKRDKPAAVLETKEVPLADLHPFPGNPRRSDIKMLRQSIRAHGVFRAMVVNQRTMEVLAGNHMLEALKAGPGMTTAPCRGCWPGMRAATRSRCWATRCVSEALPLVYAGRSGTRSPRGPGGGPQSWRV